MIHRFISIERTYDIGGANTMCVPVCMRVRTYLLDISVYNLRTTQEINKIARLDVTADHTPQLCAYHWLISRVYADGIGGANTMYVCTSVRNYVLDITRYNCKCTYVICKSRVLPSLCTYPFCTTVFYKNSIKIQTK
jgi:hypothetical protein